MSAVREAMLAKLARAREILTDLERQPGVEFTAIERQKRYVKALEEVFDLESVSLRRYLRRPTSIPAEIARIPLEPEAAGQRGKGTIVDLSLGGRGLVTGMELSVGESIELAFTLPESGTPVRVKGELRHAKRLDGEFRVGVAFKVRPR